MSLDVYLESGTHVCPGCGHEHACDQPSGIYTANITHNLNKMADAAGLYDALWHPALIVAGPEVAKQIRDLEGQRQWSDADASRVQFMAKARDLVEPLRVGLARLRGDPQRFEALNPASGWGDYAGLVRFTSDYLAACEKHPESTVRVSR